MENEISKVRAFHRAFGHPVAELPKYLPSDRALMRHRILQEEVSELLDASVSKNLVEVADAITDCLYILFGTAIEFGIADKLPALFAEVQRSNMSKLGADGKPIYREDGKILKGPNYTPPDLERILFG